jgi:hypothetical protein
MPIKSLNKNIMNKIKIAALFLMVLGAACTKDLTSLNNDPKNPGNVPSYTLFTNAQRSVARTVTSSSVNLNIFRLIVQHWQETTYTDESNYDLNTRNIPQGVWTALYRDALQDFNAAKKIIPTDVKNVAVMRNQLAITDIMQVYTFYYLVTTYGDIPYSTALDIDNVFPTFDKQDVVYNDLLTRIDTSIAALNTTAESFGTADILFGGDVAAWKRFAASLKLKMGMTIADANTAKAKTTVESAVQTGVFTSNEDNATFDFLSAPPNTNPIWEDLVQSGRKDFVAASTLVDRMEAVNDPRLPRYFTLDAASGYSGGKPGASSSYTTFSKPAVAITAPNFPGLLLDYAEVEFLLAEAVERGFNVGGTAAAHYNAAVTASITYWGGTQAQAATYLAQPAVAYATAAGNYRQKIGIQKWIALYNRGWDAWIEWRRLDTPTLQAPVDALSDIPVRFTYPVNEQNYNTENYNKAAASIGGDEVTTKLFWDKQ